MGGFYDNSPPLPPGVPYACNFTEISSYDRPNEDTPAHCGVELVFEHENMDYPEPGDYRWRVRISGTIRYYGWTDYTVGHFEDSLGFYTTVEDGNLMHGRYLD